MAELATRDRDEAHDIVQDAMWRLADRYATRPSEEWAPLFFRILERRITDWHRANKRKRSIFGFFKHADDGDEYAEVPDPNAATPEHELVADETMSELNAVLANLPLRQQQVVLLREWQGFDVAQTASVMGCSEGSVKTHYSRAMQRLRSSLAEQSE